MARTLFESLENRWLFNGATVAPGQYTQRVGSVTIECDLSVVTVKGTSHRDAIDVYLKVVAREAALTVNGKKVRVPHRITQFIVMGMGGDDRLKVSSNNLLAFETQVSIFGDDPNDPNSYGNDVILAYAEAEIMVKGGRGNDFISGAGRPDRYKGPVVDFDGEDGDDDLIGPNVPATLIGGKGNDEIWGGFCDDVIVGNQGDDYLSGGRGNDVILGGQGRNVFYGGRGDDVTIGGNDDDLFLRFDTQKVSGNDVIDGAGGFDSLFHTDPLDEDWYRDGSGIEYVQHIELWPK